MKAKASSIFRIKGIIAVVITSVLLWAFFFFFFDGLAKWAIERGAYSALGAELNIESFKSSFLKGNVEVNKIELTDKEKPSLNAIEISDVKFDVNMDAFLRLKIVIENVAVEGIQFQSTRRSPGRVAPAKPTDPNEPSFTDQLKNKALDKLAKDNDGNFVSDIASFLKSGDANAQLKNIEGLIKSKQLANDLNQKWTQSKTDWDKRIKDLPKQSDLDSYKQRFEKIKYKDFKSPQELQDSINQFNNLKAEVDTKVKAVNETKNQLSTDVNQIQKDYKSLEAQVKTDIDTVKTHFKIPKLDAKYFAKSLFMDYLTPYTQKLDRYKDTAKKYLPAKYAKLLDKKDTTEKSDDNTIQPHPRDKGTTYEFPVTWGYPMYWIQNVSISSKSNTRADYGDISGTIKDITSNQKQINKPTTFNVSGDFKSKSIFGILFNGLFSNIKESPEVSFNGAVSSYPLQLINLINNKDVSIEIPKSQNSLKFNGKTVGFKFYDINFENNFKGVNFGVKAPDAIVNEILTKTLTPINDFNLFASAKGDIKNLDIDINSNLGSKLETAFSNLLQAKLKEVNAQVQKMIDDEISKQRGELEKKVSELSQGYVKDLSSSEAALNQVKNLVDDRINLAKKDLENKAKAEVEKAGQKAVDDLKKKFGF